eukprot:98613-Heterocapsa_arctica.AAC.1
MFVEATASGLPQPWTSRRNLGVSWQVKGGLTTFSIETWCSSSGGGGGGSGGGGGGCGGGVGGGGGG